MSISVVANRLRDLLERIEELEDALQTLCDSLPGSHTERCDYCGAEWPESEDLAAARADAEKVLGGAE